MLYSATIMVNGKRFTIAQGKRLAIQQNGHLPKCGYETPVYRDLVNVCGLDYIIRKHERIIFLQNNSGLYRVWEFVSPNPHV